MLSAIGKLSDRIASAFNFSQLFGLTFAASEIVILCWSIIEIGLAILMWQQQMPWITLTIPTALLGFLLFSYWNGIDCSCFGTLPFFSQFPFGAHILLLIGMFLGLYYLIVFQKVEQEAKSTITSQRHRNSIMESSALLQGMGLAALAMMFLSFFSLPFSLSDSRNSKKGDTADQFTVEAAIANQRAVLIDARSEYQYGLGKIPSAINIPYNSDSLAMFVERQTLRHKLIIVYCSNAHCNAAELLAERLRALGCKMVRIYPGGWEEWSLYFSTHFTN